MSDESVWRERERVSQMRECVLIGYVCASVCIDKVGGLIGCIDTVCVLITCVVGCVDRVCVLIWIVDVCTLAGTKRSGARSLVSTRG